MCTNNLDTQILQIKCSPIHVHQKKLLIINCTLLFSSPLIHKSRAQSTRSGIRGGLNVANLNDTDFDVNSRIGFTAGFFYYQIKNSPASIQPEALYTQKGFKADNDTYQIDYVQVPVLARFNFVTDSSLLPFVYAGPFIGIKLNGYPTHRSF